MQKPGRPDHRNIESDDEGRIDLDDIHIQAGAVENSARRIEEKSDIRAGIAAKFRREADANQENDGQDERQSALEG